MERADLKIGADVWLKRGVLGRIPGIDRKEKIPGNKRLICGNISGVNPDEIKVTFIDGENGKTIRYVDEEELASAAALVG